MVNRVVLHRTRAVPTGVPDLETKTLIYLLARLDRVQQILPVLDQAFAALVQRKFRIDQIAMILDNPVDAIVVAGFFIGRECDDQVAIGHVAFLLKANERRDPYGSHGLVVGTAAAVEVTVFFGELERIQRPILTQRLNNVEMREEQHRLSAAGPAIPRNKISFSRIRPENLNVGFGKTGSLQPRGHHFSGCRRVADRIGGVDFDEVLIDIARKLVVRVHLRERENHQPNNEARNHGSDFPPKSTSSGNSSTSAAVSYGKCVESCSPTSSIPRIRPAVKSPPRNLSATTSTTRCQNSCPTRS